MSYDVYFKAKLEDVDIWVEVGEWINYTTNTSGMIKEVCGSRPSKWDGKSCKEMIPVLTEGISLLREDPERFRHYEPGNGWGTVETTIQFLTNVLNECQRCPYATIEVSY